MTSTFAVDAPTGGALVVANAEENKRDRVFRQLTAWGTSMIAVAPVAAWLVFPPPAA